MFGRIRCGGANFHMESGVGGGGGETMYPEKR